MLGPLLALLSSGLWGTADFLGGSLARRLPVLSVMVLSQSAALIAVAAVVPLSGGLLAPGAYLGWGVGFGLIGMVALASFYRALAVGKMGVVAPIAASGVAIPVLVGLAGGDDPAAHQIAGMVLAVAGIVLASIPGSPDEESHSDPGAGLQAVGLAFVAAMGFGTVIVFIERGGRTSVGMTLLAARCASVMLLLAVVLLRRPDPGPWRPDLRLLVGLGLLDVAANGAIAVAQRYADLSLTSVLGSIYPVVTVLLARRVHHERLSRGQAAGVTAALVGVVLIASTP
ncbi:MAG: DMT family transporter [Mycobacteriales bacterium]